MVNDRYGRAGGETPPLRVCEERTIWFSPVGATSGRPPHKKSFEKTREDDILPYGYGLYERPPFTAISSDQQIRYCRICGRGLIAVGR